MFLTAKWLQNHEVVIVALNLKPSWIAKEGGGGKEVIELGAELSFCCNLAGIF